MQSAWSNHPKFGTLFKSLIVFFLLVTILLASTSIWYKQATGSPIGSDEKKTFVIKKGESTNSFIKRLKEENVIKDELAFKIYLFFSGSDKEIQAGSYQFSANQTAKEVIEVLTTGRFDKWITVVEGLRKEEIAAVVAENFKIDEKDFLKKVTEGYLFPDTYLIPIGADVDTVVEIFRKNFDKKVTGDITSKAEANGLSKQQLVILASIVERETRSENERPVVSGILIKRFKEGTPIGADATLQYALGYSSQEGTWWRKNITVDDLGLSSLFNTRENAGLPPGPICSPGLSSIKAVANPKDSPYYYYIHDKDGQIHYAKTAAEHQQNINSYLAD